MKALLESSEQYAHVQNGLASHGIAVGEVRLDLDTMMQRKQRVVKELTQGIAQLFKANGVTHVPGQATLSADRCVIVSHAESETTLSAENIILAPGSSPVQLPGIEQDGKYIVDSSGALSFSEVPSRLGIIGAGVIGLELGSVWHRLGAEQVVLLEAQDSFLPMADEQVAKLALRSFTGQGLDVHLGSLLRGVKAAHEGNQPVGAVQRFGDGLGREFGGLAIGAGQAPAAQVFFRHLGVVPSKAVTCALNPQ